MTKLLVSLLLALKLLPCGGDAASESPEGLQTCLVQTNLIVQSNRENKENETSLHKLLHQNGLLATSSKVTEKDMHRSRQTVQADKHELIHLEQNAPVDMFQGRAQIRIFEYVAAGLLAVTLFIYSCNVVVPSQLGRRVAQINWIVSELMKGIGFLVLLPVSYPFAQALGYGMFMSGLLLSSWPLGGIFGQMLARKVLPEASGRGSNYREVRSLICRSQFLLACTFLGYIAAIWSPLRASYNGLWWTLIACRVCSGFASGCTCLASSYMALEVTPQHEVMNLQTTVTGAKNFGMTFAVLISSMAMLVFGDDDIWLQGSVPLMPPFLVVISVALTFALLMPLTQLPKDVEETEESVAGDHVNNQTRVVNTLDGLELSERRKLIDQAVVFNWERGFSLAAIEVCSSLISEVEYGFSPMTVGWIFGGITVAAGALNMAIAGILSSDMQTRATAMYWQAFAGVCATVFIFSVWPWWSLYIADTFVFVFANAANGICNGLAILASVPGSPYSKESFMNKQMLAMSISRFLSAPVSRGLYAVMGRNGYACAQVLLTCIGLGGIRKMWIVVQNLHQADPKEVQAEGKGDERQR